MGKGSTFYFTLIFEEADGVQAKKDEISAELLPTYATNYPMRILMAEVGAVSQLKNLLLCANIDGKRTGQRSKPETDDTHDGETGIYNGCGQ